MYLLFVERIGGDLEHETRIESFEGNFECLGENSKKTRQKSYNLSVFKNANLFLECAFVSFPGRQIEIKL